MRCHETRDQAFTDGSYTVKYRVILPDGQLRHIHSWAYLITDEAGQPIQLVGVTQDITERHTAELALRTSEEQFRTLVHNIPGITYRCLADEPWTILFMSEVTLATTGLSCGRFHRPSRTHFPPNYSPR
jgi:PAS domain-containing protein